MTNRQTEAVNRRRNRGVDGDHFRWRAKVLVQDGYLCQQCGQHGGENGRGLHAHHLISYAADPSLRYDVGNGVTLCMACHRKLHSKEVPTEPVPCACGCGTMIAPVDIHHKRPRRYVNGHASRGAKRSAATGAKISAAKKGTTQTAASNAKRSATLMGRIISDETRAKMSRETKRWRRAAAPEVSFGGRSMGLADWADETGIPYERLWKRLDKGWSVGEALTTPVRPKKRKGE
jgi:hypothetical protein